MIKMIDDVLEEEVTGYGYKNRVGNTETVRLHETFLDVLNIHADGKEIYIYKSDVPKLIKALTFAAKL